MTWTDWIVPIALVLLVVRQLRERRASALGLLWPVGLVLWAAADVLGPPLGGAPDLVLVAIATAVGLGLGCGCGALSRVRRRQGDVTVRATGVAAALWILGMVGRLAFGLWATDGGGPAIARLTEQLHLRSPSTWATALVAMALAEVVARTGVLLLRVARARIDGPD